MKRRKKKSTMKLLWLGLLAAAPMANNEEEHEGKARNLKVSNTISTIVKLTESLKL